MTKRFPKQVHVIKIMPKSHFTILNAKTQVFFRESFDLNALACCCHCSKTFRLKAVVGLPRNNLVFFRVANQSPPFFEILHMERDERKRPALRHMVTFCECAVIRREIMVCSARAAEGVGPYVGRDRIRRRRIKSKILLPGRRGRRPLRRRSPAGCHLWAAALDW